MVYHTAYLMQLRSFEALSSKPQEKCGRAGQNASASGRNAPIGLHCPPIFAAIGDHSDKQQRAPAEETMTPRTSSAASQNLRSAQPDGRDDRTNLSHQYGSIGIQAVAAAARYSDRRESPAHETVPASAPGLRIDLRFVESAS